MTLSLLDVISPARYSAVAGENARPREFRGRAFPLFDIELTVVTKSSTELSGH